MKKNLLSRVMGLALTATIAFTSFGTTTVMASDFTDETDLNNDNNNTDDDVPDETGDSSDKNNGNGDGGSPAGNPDNSGNGTGTSEAGDDEGDDVVIPEDKTGEENEEEEEDEEELIVEEKEITIVKSADEENHGNCGYYALYADGSMNGILDWKYEPDSKKLSILGDGYMYDYSLENPAPWADKDIESIEISMMCYKVGDYAFYGLSNVKEISYYGFPVLTEIGDHAFDFSSGCSLSSLKLPHTVTSIGDQGISGTSGSKITVSPSKYSDYDLTSIYAGKWVAEHAEAYNLISGFSEEDLKYRIYYVDPYGDFPDEYKDLVQHTYLPGDTIMLYPAEADGKAFLGWQLNNRMIPDSDRYSTRFSTDGLEGMLSFYAVWQDSFPLYIDNYVTGGGRKSTGKTVKPGEPLPELPAQANTFESVFIGWEVRTFTRTETENGHRTTYEYVTLVPGDIIPENVDYTTINGQKAISIYAVYTPAEYTVNYHLNLNGNDAVVSKTYKSSYARGTSMSLTQGALSDNDAFNNIENSANFSGWALSANGEVIFDGGNTAEDVRQYASSQKKKTIDLYAIWEGNQKFNFTLKDSETEEAQVKNFEAYTNETFILTGNEFKKQDYTLTGWKYIKTVGGKEITTTLKPSATIKESVMPESAVLVAQWKANTYTVKYNFNGGKVAKGVKNSVSLVKDKVADETALLNYTLNDDGEYVPNESQVSRTGYTFTGWKVGDVEYTHFGEIHSSVTLVAQWEAYNYDIALDLQGGEVRETTDVYTIEGVPFGETVNLQNYVPVFQGRKFNKWVILNDQGKVVKSFASNAKVKDLTTENGGTVTLTAQWTDIKYTIKYDYAGGALPKGVKNPAFYYTKNGETITEPVKAGYEFVEWTMSNTTAGITSDFEDIGEYNKVKVIGGGNITLKANWRAVGYDIYLQTGNEPSYEAGSIATLSYEKTLTADFLANTSKFYSNNFVPEGHEGQSIIGFATTPNAKTATYKLTSDYKMSVVAKSAVAAGTRVIDLYPVWGDKVNYIEYADGLGENYTVNKSLYTFKTSRSAIALPTAIKTGYVFKGWEAIENGEVKEGILSADGKKILAGVDKNIIISPVFESVSYSIKLDPNGKGVKDSVNSSAVTKAYTAFYDVRYADGTYDFAGDRELAYLPGTWTREGYDFLGFSKNKKATVAEYTSESVLEGLTTGKSVTLYAVWQAHDFTIDYTSNGIMVDGAYSDAFTVDDSSFVKTGLYGVKDITLPKLSVPGYTFQGWTVVTDHPSVALSKAGYVIKINKTNTAAAVMLKPCFTENRYNVKINLGGGYYYKYDAKGKKVNVTAAYTSNQLSGIRAVSDAENIAREIRYAAPVAKKKGYTYAGLFLDAKGTKPLTDETSFAGMTSKNGATVNVYMVWKKVAPANISGLGAKLVANDMEGLGTNKICLSLDNRSDFDYVEVQYSNNYNFKYSVSTYYLKGSNTAFSTPYLNGNKYYIKARGVSYDSEGNKVYGKWSSTVSAVREVN